MSLLQGTEAPICQPNQIPESFFGLSGFIPLTIIPYSYSMWALTEDTDKENVDSIKRHYQSSGVSSQGSEGSVVCSSIHTSTIKGV